MQRAKVALVVLFRTVYILLLLESVNLSENNTSDGKSLSFLKLMVK